MRFSCQSCGAEVECAIDKLPCQALEGWLAVGCFEGRGAISQYYFCSFTCLKSWVDAKVPKIPLAFLKSFGEGKNT